MSSEVVWSPLKPPHRSTLLQQPMCLHPSRTTWVPSGTALPHRYIKCTVHVRSWFITPVCQAAHDHVCTYVRTYVVLWWTHIDITNAISAHSGCHVWSCQCRVHPEDVTRADYSNKQHTTGSYTLVHKLRVHPMDIAATRTTRATPQMLQFPSLVECM